MVEQVQLSHIPPELSVFVAFFKDVQNAAFLREQLLAGNQDFEYAFIDASVVVSRKQVLAATFRALNDYLHDRLKSRNVHSEIVFSLSPNNNIGEAFRRFGVSDGTRDLIVVKIASSPSTDLESVTRHLHTSIKGHACELNDQDLKTASDIARIRKIYKIPAAASKQPTNGVHHATDGFDQLEVQVLGSMALRGAT